jgi:hypothetical protein
MKRLCIILIVSVLGLAGCAASAQKAVLDTSGESQLRLRQIQTRYFDTADKKKTLECVLATLQDLGFVIDKASYELGSVSATKLSGYSVRMTVNVVPKGENRMMVRASAQYNIQAIEDPRPYQQFFEALSKSMFLQAHMED